MGATMWPLLESVVARLRSTTARGTRRSGSIRISPGLADPRFVFPSALPYVSHAPHFLFLGGARGLGGGVYGGYMAGGRCGRSPFSTPPPTPKKPGTREKGKGNGGGAERIFTCALRGKQWGPNALHLERSGNLSGRGCIYVSEPRDLTPPPLN